MSSYFKQYFFGFFITALGLNVAIASPAEELDNLLKKMKTLNADFVQTVRSPGQVSSYDYTGHFSMQRPDHFRWDIKAPDPQLIVGDSKNIWIYDKDLEQVTVQPMSKQLGDVPALLLSGNYESIADNFTILSGGNKNNIKWFKLVSKAKDGFVKGVLLGFEGDKIKHMVLTDGVGQETRLTFSKVIVNQTLPAKLFKFTPPKNVDVIGEPN